MLRKAMDVVLGVVLLVGGVLTAGTLSLRAPPVKGKVLALSDAERHLINAARVGDTEVVVGLIQAGTPLDARDARGFTPLILAAYHGHLDTVRALLERGADACAGDNRGNTALMGAAFKGYSEVVELLGQQPCAVDQTNRFGQTALMFASLFGREDVAKTLRQRGASAELRDSSGRSAEDWARTQDPQAPIATPGSGPRLISGVRQ
jgi:hypothetical protein